jgi:membrane protease subunit HflK
MSRRTALLVLGIVAGLAYLATGWTVVAPGEAVVVRRLGRVLPRPWTPGSHWGWPRGIDRLERVRTDEVRRLEIGLAGTPGPDDAPGAGEFLTGDLNLLRARGIVQYRVADPVAFVLHAAGSDRLLTRLAEAGLTRALARRGIDAALRAERVALAHDAEEELSRSVSRYGLGLTILGVSLTDARPPAEVQPDFDAAQSAQSEHERRLNEARTYAAVSLPAARASALTKTEQARAEAHRKVVLAQGRAERFLTLLAEAERSRELTVRRLYLDALRELLPRVRRKLVLTPDEPVDLSLFGAEPTPATRPQAPASGRPANP